MDPIEKMRKTARPGLEPEQEGHSAWTVIRDSAAMSKHSMVETTAIEYMAGALGADSTIMYTPEEAKQIDDIDVDGPISSTESYLRGQLKKEKVEDLEKFGRHFSWETPGNAALAFLTLGGIVSFTPVAMISGAAVGAAAGAVVPVVGPIIGAGLGMVGAAAKNTYNAFKTVKLAERIGKAAQAARQAKLAKTVVDPIVASAPAVANSFRAAVKSRVSQNVADVVKPMASRQALSIGTGNLLEELAIQAVDAQQGYKYELGPEGLALGFFAPAIMTGLIKGTADVTRRTRIIDNTPEGDVPVTAPTAKSLKTKVEKNMASEEAQVALKEFYKDQVPEKGIEDPGGVDLGKEMFGDNKKQFDFSETHMAKILEAGGEIKTPWLKHDLPGYHYEYYRERLYLVKDGGDVTNPKTREEQGHIPAREKGETGDSFVPAKGISEAVAKIHSEIEFSKHFLAEQTPSRVKAHPMGFNWIDTDNMPYEFDVRFKPDADIDPALKIKKSITKNRDGSITEQVESYFKEAENTFDMENLIDTRHPDAFGTIKAEYQAINQLKRMFGERAIEDFFTNVSKGLIMMGQKVKLGDLFPQIKSMKDLTDHIREVQRVSGKPSSKLELEDVLGLSEEVTNNYLMNNKVKREPPIKRDKFEDDLEVPAPEKVIDEQIKAAKSDADQVINSTGKAADDIEGGIDDFIKCMAGELADETES